MDRVRFLVDYKRLECVRDRVGTSYSKFSLHPCASATLR